MSGRTLRRGRAAAFAALLCGALLLPAGAAEARKVGNPGNFTASVTGGLFRIKTQSFDLAQLNPDPTLAGTVSASGAVTFPTSGISFPSLPFDSGQGIVQVSILPTHDWTGNLNPLNGAMTLRARFRLKLTGNVGPLNTSLGDNCTIGTSSSPIDLNVGTTGTTSPPGPNGPITGTPYNPSGGTVTIVNNSFAVPGASGCPSVLGISINDEINSSLGLPSAAGNNEARLALNFSPDATKGVIASYTATPSSGITPLNVSFNGAASTCTAPCSYRWDFNGDGSTDQTTAVATTSHTYTSTGSFDSTLTTVDADGDSDVAERTVTVNPPPPDLSIDKSHSGNFLATADGVYTLAVSNLGSGATQGATTVTDTLPSGLGFVSGSGSGWSCSAVLQTVTCTRAATIGAGAAAPDITLTTAVAATAPASLTNTASVSTVAGSSPETVLGNNSDSDPTDVEKIDVGIGKDDVGSFETGTVETYELEVTSNGSIATAGATTVTDTLPAGLSYQGFSAPAGWGCSASGQLVTCTRDAGFAPGGSETIELQVVAGAVAVPSVNNSASVTTPNDSNAANNTSALVTTPVTATVDLTVDKSHSGVFRVGSAASYAISVQNRGARPTSGDTTVTDTLPDGLTPTAASGTGWSCNVTGQDVSCSSSEELGANELAPLLTVDVQVDETALPSVTNTASVATAGTGLDADSNAANNSDDDLTAIAATDLEIEKSHVGGFPLGGQGTYTLLVRNEGGAGTVGTTTVTDTLPAELSYSNASGPGWSCSAGGQLVTCERSGSIGGGQAAPPISLVVDVADTEEEETTNTASVSTADDIDPGNDSASDPTPLTAADLEITKSHSGDFKVGATRAYVLRVGNVGSQPTAGDTVVSDELPDGLSYVNATGSGWSCSAAGDDVTCTRSATIAPGANAPPITVQAAVGPEAYPSVTNEADVSNPEDRNDANDTASDPTTVNGADLALQKSHLGALQVGDRASYLIRVENAGSAGSESAATVTDTLPDGLTYAGSPSPDWDCSASGQDVTCEHPDSIAAGAHSDLELRADVTATAADEVVNSATVALAGDPNPANDTDDDTASVGRIDLAIDKSHAGDLTRGGSGSYTLEVHNEGGDPTDGPTHVSDDLPAGLSYESASGTGWSCSVSAGTVGCTHAGTIAGGASAGPITLNVDVAPDAPSPITNTAGVSTSDDADPANDSDADEADVSEGRDGAISIRPQLAPGGAFRVNQNGSYTVTVRNTGHGSLAGPVTATVDLPDGLAYADASGGGFSCSHANGLVTCTDSDGMAPDTRADITLEVAVERTAVPGVTTTAELSAPGDVDGSNDQAQAATDVTMIDLSIALGHTGSFAIGIPSAFTINVENIGSASTVTPVRVRDELPQGLAFAGGSGAGWSCGALDQLVQCTLDSPLGPGAQAPPLSLSVTPAASVAGTQLTNTASVLTEDDAQTQNDQASDSVTIGPAAQALGQTGTSKCKKKRKKKGRKGKKRKKCKKKKKKKK